MIQFIPHGAALPRNSTEKASENFMKGFMSERERQNELKKIAEQAKNQRLLKEYETAQAMKKLAQKHEYDKDLKKYELDLKATQQKELFNDVLSQLSGGSQQPDESNINQGFNPENIGPQHVIAGSAASGKIGQALGDIYKSNVKQQMGKTAQEIQEKQFAHKETAKFADTIREKASGAQESLDAIQASRKALKTGQTGLNAKNLLFKVLSSKKSPFANLFATSESQTLINAAKTLTGGALKEIFSKPTEREFFWFENVLPDIFKSEEVNETSLKYFEKIANYNLKRQSEFDKIVKENKGYRPIDIETQLNDRMKPEIDKIVDEGYKISGLTGEIVEVVNPQTGQHGTIDKGQLDQLPKGWRLKSQGSR